MPNEYRADPTLPPHQGQGRGGSKKESFSLRVRPALHPPERPSPRRADMVGHGLGRETRERRLYNHIINRHAETLDKNKRHDELGYNSICYIGSRIGWVSTKEVYNKS